MPSIFKTNIRPQGTPPGSLIFKGTKKTETPFITVIDYTLEEVIEYKTTSTDQLKNYKDTQNNTWINLYGVHDSELLQHIGEKFDIHPLVLEDVMNTGQRAKIEEFDNYTFFVLKMLRFDEEESVIISEQMSIILADNFVLTFQEQPGDIFHPVRDRIRKKKGRVRQNGNDYLAYAILDVIIDNYLIVIERLGEEIDDLENEILENPTKDILENIYSYKKELNYFLKLIRPVKEITLRVLRADEGVFKDTTVPFLRDLQDHMNHVVETSESYKAMLSDYLNIYHTGISSKMNEVMKVLTIIATIFIPLTFIAGIYGMNFENMPELHFKYGYFVVWGILIVTGIVMLLFFKRKRWL